MFLPELGKQIQGERGLSSNNRIIRISEDSNNRESTVNIMPKLSYLTVRFSTLIIQTVFMLKTEHLSLTNYIDHFKQVIL